MNKDLLKLAKWLHRKNLTSELSYLKRIVAETSVKLDVGQKVRCYGRDFLYVGYEDYLQKVRPIILESFREQDVAISGKLLRAVRSGTVRFQRPPKGQGYEDWLGEIRYAVNTEGSGWLYQNEIFLSMGRGLYFLLYKDYKGHPIVIYKERGTPYGLGLNQIEGEALWGGEETFRKVHKGLVGPEFTDLAPKSGVFLKCYKAQYPDEIKKREGEMITYLEPNIERERYNIDDRPPMTLEDFDKIKNKDKDWITDQELDLPTSERSPRLSGGKIDYCEVDKDHPMCNK